jgi:hypothetical protein
VRPRAQQNRFGANLCAGIISNNVVGLFVLPVGLNAEIFLEFLQNDFQALLEDLPLANTNGWRTSAFWQNSTGLM